MDTPEVTDKTVKPAGLLPKNAQRWIILATATVVCGAIFLAPTAPPPKAAAAPVPPDVTGVPPGRIDQYSKELEAEVKRLNEQRAGIEAQTAAARAAIAAGGSAPVPAEYGQQQHQPEQPDPAREARAQIEAEQRKREYTSLFASNTALSYRTASSSAALAPPGPAAGQPGGRESPSPATRSGSIDSPPVEQKSGFPLYEGTIIETVLTNRLDGSFNGPVNAMVTNAVYSHDRQRVLIPQGARALGEAKQVSDIGDSRLAVVFHRIIMPNGTSVSLDSFQGLNQIGETGLKDKVNRHYLRLFGVSMAVGAVAGISQLNTRYGYDSTGSDAYRQGFSLSASQSGLRILDRFLNILPTHTVREGHRIKVYLTNDLMLPEYTP